MRESVGHVLLTRSVMKLHDASDAIRAAGRKRQRMRDRSRLITARSRMSNLNLLRPRAFGFNLNGMTPEHGAFQVKSV